MACKMDKKTWSRLLTIFVITMFAATSAQKLPKYFKVCRSNDADVGQCIVESINGARKHIIQGIPELGLDPVDPLFVREMRVEDGQQDVNLRIVIRNVTWSGIKSFVATAARLDFKKRYLELDTQLTEMSLRGLYTFGGRLLTFRIVGDGDFDADFAGLNCTHSIDFEETIIDGALHWKVKKWHWNVEAKTLQVDFRNLFQGNKRLGRFANQFLNTNWRAAWLVYGHLAEQELGNRFKDHVNNLFERVPLSEMFAP